MMNKSSPIYVLFFVMAVCVFFGVGLSGVHHATLDTLAKNEKLHKNRAISQAFLLDVHGDQPEDYQTAIDRHIKKTSLTHEGRDFEVFATRSPRERVVGFRFSGLGFWGPITGIAVFSDDLQTMVNIRFLEHQETPGLGGRIEESWFTDQFKGLKIFWDKPPEERIIVGGPEDTNAKNRVDAITGASQTSMALMKSLNTELALFQKAYANRTIE
jgi:Na+-transporting NADH:ubiquinone oxidoreductase subunit C